PRTGGTRHAAAPLVERLRYLRATCVLDADEERLHPPSVLGSSLTASGTPSALDVEADVEDVAVLDDVRLPFQALLAGARSLGVAAGRDEIVPAHDLAADEAARDVGMNRLRRVDRGFPASERPGPRLLLAGREERDQVERLDQPAHNLAERGFAAAAELGRLLVGQVGELGFELQIDSLRAVYQLEQRLRRERIELGWQLLLPVGQRVPRIEVREEPLEICGFRLQPGVSGLRLLRHSLQPALDVVAVRDEELELQRLEVVGRDQRAREAVENDE